LKKHSSHDLQIKALRDALDRASLAVSNSNASAVQASTELKNERRRSFEASAELVRLTRELQETREENKRLRHANGDELQNERRRYAEASAELIRLARELEETLIENKRLRRANGDLCQERETLTHRIRDLAIVSDPTAQSEQVLRVIETLEPEPSFLK
jgi:hypothetical protein